jgi:hypothetical protein
MKQRISTAQLQELSPEQQERLREWWLSNAQVGDTCILRQRFYVVGEVGDVGLVLYRPKEDESIFYKRAELKDDIISLLSIGQCFSLLGKTIAIKYMEKYPLKEPIDALFAAVKEVL